PPLQRAGRLLHHRAAACRSSESRHSGGRGARDPAAAPHLPAMAAPTGPRARDRARGMSVVTVDDLALRFGERSLFEDLSFALEDDARARVGSVLAEVGAAAYADAPVGRLSGGEQQRLRVAQALVADPVLILADEPLLSLDLAHQRDVVDLLDARRRSAGTPIVFVTHDVNPVLHSVDRVLYLAPGSWAIGTP